MLVEDEWLVASRGSYRESFELAKRFQRDADAAGMGGTFDREIPARRDKNTFADRFDRVVTSELLRSASRKLFADGHYARAVEEAFKCMNNQVKEKAGILDGDGSGLMKRAFGAKSPILLLNRLQSESDRDEQLGYMEIYAGSMTGIRNPRAHEHMLKDDADVALELLTLANHLMRRLDGAIRADRDANGPNKA